MVCPPEFSKELGEFSKIFDSKDKLREAARFAMAIGIHKGKREKRSEWKKGATRNIAHLNGQFDDAGRFDFKILFEMLDLLEEEDETPLNIIISEYITGGMRWIVENEMVDGTNFSVLEKELPDLFTSD